MVKTKTNRTFTSPQDLESNFDEAFQFTEKDRAEAEDAWGLYSGFDYRQWEREAVSDLRNSGRRVAQYNFVRGKIDRLAGSIIKNTLEVDYVPVDVAQSDLTRTLKTLYTSDKELMDWSQDFQEALTDGLIHLGVEEMYISDKYSALGNIGFRRIIPNHIILDPEWITHKSYDLTKAWKVAYMTPLEMKNKYKAKSDRIDSLVYQYAMQGLDLEKDESSGVIPYYNLDEVYGQKFRIVEYHYIVENPIEVELVMGKDIKLEIPHGLAKEERDAFLTEHNVSDVDIIKHRKVNREYWISTSCAQLDPEDFLEDKKHALQIGRLPLFPFSAGRINGRNSGIPMLLKDAQQSINNRESLSDHMIATSAHGATMIDPSVVGNDQALLTQFLENWDKPNAKLLTSPGALASGRRYTQQMEKTQYNGELYAEINRMGDYIDKISGQTAALDGVNENSRETGILFARKQLQGEVALTSLMKAVSQHENDKGEAYMEAAKFLYSGVYREVQTNYKKSGESEVVKLNDFKYTEQGKEIINDLSMLPRHKVVISQSPEGVTTRITERAINAELLRSIPPNNVISQAQLVKNIMKTLELPSEDRAKMEEASELEYQLAVAQVQSQISQLQPQPPQAPQMGQEGQAMPQVDPTQAGGQIPPEMAAMLSQGGEPQ